MTLAGRAACFLTICELNELDMDGHYIESLPILETKMKFA